MSVNIHYSSIWDQFPAVANMAQEDVVRISRYVMVTCEYAMAHMFDDIDWSCNVTISVGDVPQDPDGDGLSVGVCNSPIHLNEVQRIRNLQIIVSPFQTDEQFIDTLLHELTHAKQILDGRLASSFIKHGKTVKLWEGRAYSTRFIDYRDWPWEVEAREEAAEHHYKMARDYSEDIPCESLRNELALHHS